MICATTKITSRTARGLIAVIIETRLAAVATSLWALKSSGRSSARSAMSMRSRPSMMAATASPTSARPRRSPAARRSRAEALHQSARGVAIVGGARQGQIGMQPGDRALPDDRGNLAGDERQRGEERQRAERDADPAERLRLFEKRLESNCVDRKGRSRAKPEAAEGPTGTASRDFVLGQRASIADLLRFFDFSLALCDRKLAPCDQGSATPAAR